MKTTVWITMYTVLVLLLGLTVGIPIGLVLDDFFHRWSARMVTRIMGRFRSEREEQ